MLSGREGWAHRASQTISNNLHTTSKIKSQSPHTHTGQLVNACIKIQQAHQENAASHSGYPQGWGDISNLINTIPVICTLGIIRILPSTIRAVSTPGDTYQLSFCSLRPYPPHYRTNFVVFTPGSILTLPTTVLILWSSPRVVSSLSPLLY